MYYYQPTKNTAPLQRDHLGPFELFKLPLEVRRLIYDKVAAEETKVGIHISLDEDLDDKPKARAYTRSALSRTNSELRKEYSDILLCQIRKMLKAKDASRFSSYGFCPWMDRFTYCSRSYQMPDHTTVFRPYPVIDPLALESKLLVAECRT